MRAHDKAATIDAYRRLGSKRAVAVELGIGRATVQRHLKDATLEEYTVDPLPSVELGPEELWAARKKHFDRVNRAHTARKLIQVKVKLDGPVGILHFGDPHTDGDTDLHQLEEHARIVRETPGLFAGNIGDQQNNWIGRLQRLYGEQSTSAKEAWILTEHFLGMVKDWLYLVGGNHDAWVGANDPLQWIMRGNSGPVEYHGCRLNLTFPNGREVRVNARHDFQGHSQWNVVHGPSKAAQMGWRDHILVCGHKHTTGYTIVKDPASDLISHAIRVATYKIHDEHARAQGFPDHNISPCCVTVIDPSATMERNLVQVFFDAEHGADYLTWRRGKK